jgi:surface carbohydrate biosynthesis protein
MKIFVGLKLIAKATRKWAQLPRVDIAIFDTHCGAHLSRIIQDYSLFSIDIRGESYHMPTLFAACWQYILCLGKVPISNLYFSMLIMKLGAKICITNQDAHSIFYKLDKQLPDVRFIAMQQGLKDDYSIDNFSNISGDYFAFGHVYADKLANGVANMHICGSIKANMAKLTTEKLPRLCYISGFVGSDIGLKVFRNVNYAEFTYPAIYSALREIDHFCSTQGIELIIASKANREVTTQGQKHVFRNEWDLYEKILGRRPPLIMADSYELADESELIVCDQSALGYELLGWDCKVVFINLIAYYHREKSYEFGWPLVLPKQGIFWTNKYDPDHIQNMLNHVWHMSSEEWKDLIIHYQEQLMHYDQGNSILLNHIKSILTSSLQ